MSLEQEKWIYTVHEEVKAFLNQLGIPFKDSDGCIGFEYNGNDYTLQSMDSDFMFDLVHILEWDFTKPKGIDLLEITNLIHSEFSMVRMEVSSAIVIYRIQNIVYPGADIKDLMEFSLSQLDEAIDISKQLIRCRLDEMERFSQIVHDRLGLSNAQKEDELSDDEEPSRSKVLFKHIKSNKYEA